MLTIQALAEIAFRYETATSDAMIVACVQRHYLTGEPLALPVRPTSSARRGERPADGAPWREYVERNGDTRLNHC